MSIPQKNPPHPNHLLPSSHVITTHDTGIDRIGYTSVLLYTRLIETLTDLYIGLVYI